MVHRLMQALAAPARYRKVAGVSVRACMTRGRLFAGAATPMHAIGVVPRLLQAFRATVRTVTVGLAKASALILMSFAMGLTGIARAAPGDVIENTATARYEIGSGSVQTPTSNTDSITILGGPGTDAEGEILRFLPPGVSGESVDMVASVCGGNTLAVPSLLGIGTVSLDGSTAVEPVDSVNAGDPVVISVTDADEDKDTGARDSIEVTVTSSAGDSETLTLFETGDSTGRFVGYLPTTLDATAQDDCLLTVSLQGDVSFTYTDPDGGGDSVGDSAVISPASLVFTSEEGEPVDGAEITLVDADSGETVADLGRRPLALAEASVQGVDGSSYPATVVSGETAQDAGGRDYPVGAGEYRYPVVPPGTYRLEVKPPQGAVFPSQRSPSELEAVLGGDAAISGASYGETFDFPGGPFRVDIALDTRPSTPATIDFLGFDRSGEGESLPIGPTSCAAGGAGGEFSELDDPEIIGQGSVDGSGTLQLSPASLYKAGDPVFISVEDQDQNRNTSVRETVEVTLSVEGTGEEEHLRLTETGPDTGIFLGYIQTARPPAEAGDCVLQVAEDAEIVARYVDEDDDEDVTSAAALVDPFGVLFDTTTGEPVDGATVTLLNADTGLPAQVFGDDGVSAYPATVISGDGTTDASGATYDFPAGEYRFPFVAPGNYQLVVRPPEGYRFPSEVSEADIQDLPGAPYAMELGSYGEVFVVNPGPALNIDLPLDPVATSLFVQKVALSEMAAIGDFIQYEITVENADTMPAVNAEAEDTLPTGFRYQPGSARYDGQKGPDPTIADDGRTMTFELGDIPPGETVSIRYVVEVSAAARKGPAENRVVGRAEGSADSNAAGAIVMVREELFRSEGFLIGSTVLGSCDDDITNDLEGVGGIRIYLEDGRYVVTDDDGLYHFEGVKPGTHVLQVDLDSVPEDLEVVACNPDTRYAGRSYSRFVDLPPGGLWRNDFYFREKAPASGSVDLGLRGRLSEDQTRMDVSLDLSGGPLAVDGLAATVLLPEGAAGVEGSYRLDGEPVVPEARGQALVFRLGSRAGDWSQRLDFEVDLGSGEAGESLLRALASFKGPGGASHRTEVAELALFRDGGREPMSFEMKSHFASGDAALAAEDIRRIEELAAEVDGLADVHLEVVGHTDDWPVVRPNELFSDNQELSWARARNVARLLGEHLGLAPAQISVRGEGQELPTADNATEDGRAKNRRVEIRVHGAKSVAEGETDLRRDQASVSADFTEERKARGADTASEELDVMEEDAPDLTPALAAQQTPGRDFVYPSPEVNPGNPTTWVIVKHPLEEKVRLKVNGRLVPPIQLESTEKAKDVAVTGWRAVRLEEGDNTLVVEFMGKDGQVVEARERSVHYSGPPVRIQMLPERSNLVADGKTPPQLAVQMYDRWGHPVRPGLIGEYAVEPPYRPLQDVEKARRQNAIIGSEGRTLFRTDRDGIAMVELEPTTRTGEVVVDFAIGERSSGQEYEVRSRLIPGERDWILVGLAQGTAGYNTVSGNMQAITEESQSPDYWDDGRVAFFAKGQIKGEFLLTLAYDTDKEREQDPSRLLGTIDPDSFYTIYGDGTNQRYDAASQEKLYLKIERGTFSALFGDYDTGLTVTELSRYSRTLNGLKSSYQGERFGYNAFAAKPDQKFVKDELQGDGTSGLYQLSSRPLIINSETVAIEVRDRFQGDEVLERKVLQRHLDYDIDYRDGTLFFKRPVQSRDEEFNPVFIVVDYEVDAPMAGDLVAGGRGSATFAEGKVEVGITSIHDQTENASGDLQGVDLAVEVTDTTRFEAEIASSDSENSGVESGGDGYRAEVTHRGEKLDGRAYISDVDEGFGLGQQRGAQVGTKKVGVEGRYHVNEEVSLEGQAYTQENKASGADRRVAEVGARLRKDDYSVSAGVRHARDQDTSGGERGSDQVYAGGSYTMLDGDLTLRAQTEQSLGDVGESTDFPDRILLGADYKLTDSTDIFAEQEFADGEDFDASTTRVGLRSRPWDGGEVRTSLDRDFREDGARLMANVGLTQRMPVGERWTVDFGVDRAQTIGGPGPVPFDTDHPPSSGTLNNDFTAISAGANYKHEDFTMSHRLEWRDGEQSDKWGLFSGFFREPSQGRGLSASFSLFDTRTVAGEDSTTADLRLGYAYRPRGSKWSILDRADLIFDETSGLSGNRRSWRLVNNLNANYMMDAKTQFSLQYGAKYVRANFDDFSATGYTDLMGVGFRRDINERWDFGGKASVLHSWNSDVYDYQFGLDVGWNLFTNTWISFGYNFMGYEDEDFSRNQFTAKGPYMTVRFKFDQDTVRELKHRMMGQEAKEPVQD